MLPQIDIGRNEKEEDNVSMSVLPGFSLSEVHIDVIVNNSWQ